jgi:Tfp pilus assembly protein PilW
MNARSRQLTTRQRGATILEFLIYVAIISTVLVTVARFSAEFVSTQAKAVAIAEVSQNARFAMARLEAEVRGSTGINVGASTFGSSPGTLSVSTASGATNPTIFTLTSGVLTVKQGTGATLALTGSKVEVLEFQVDNVSATGKTRAVRLHLRVKHLNPGGLEEFNSETTVESTVRIPYIDGFGS